MHRLSVAFALFIALHSCNSANNSTPTAVEQTLTKETFDKGKVIAAVSTAANAGESFALYLPSTYTDSSKLPVIIFFDSHAEGALPVNRYAALAEVNNFILMGSNNSKNGMEMADYQRMSNTLVSEALSRFNADAERITLCGFSGGAKVAMLTAVENSQVSNVIYCGAAQIWNRLEHPLNLLGFAGTRDMNYSELLMFHESPYLKALQHYIIEWNGKHEWPDTSVFKWAFIEKYSDIPADVVYQHTEKKYQAIQQEEELKQQLIDAYSIKELSWWKTKIAELNATKKTNIVSERLLGYISLSCYSLAGQTLKQNDLEGAKKILTIYQMADPDNPDVQKMWELYKQRGGM